MTGYGRREVTAAGIRFTIEARSVNNRYIDVQVKVPRTLAVLEARFKKAVQDRFSRGRFDLFVNRNAGQTSTGRLALDEALAGEYIAVLKQMRDRFNLGGAVDLSLVAGLQGLITVSEEKEDTEALWPALAEGLAQALNELDRMRGEEGQALLKDMALRLDSVNSLIREIRTLSPLTVETARKRMAETLNRLMNEQPDPVRLAQEIAILAERTDVTEELTRLDSHLVQFRSLLGAMSEPVGRKLDFLLQEMGREANTIASKAMDAAISYKVVTIKAELEKIREQAQNIE